MAPIPAPDTQPRIDRNASTPTGWIRPEVVTGTAAAHPQPPAHLTSDTGEWDLPICRWTSAPNGALSDLVDERYFNSGGVLAIHSWHRPKPDRDMIARERDTGRWVAWDRDKWRVLSEDTGWVPFQPEGLWRAGSYPLKIRKINNVVHLKGSVERTTSTLPEKDTDSLVANLWADFRPPADHWWNAIVSGPSYTSLQLTPTGVLKVRQHADTIPVGRQVFLDTTYMVGDNP
jgi:hypothetical protein